MNYYNKLYNFCLVLLAAIVLGFATSSHAQYNSIATAYVTTTISQNVVFDNTMKQGGSFVFSVLAHNGGGRAGQSDTANVKMQFYTATGQEVHTVASPYSGNLPNPNAVCGNPCIDPAVPWTTVSINLTLTAAQASNIAYVKISMYGIDGSYWAGDYGPWYRAPTLTLNGGGNLAYNPEFGPYNGITAQGWTSSPGFGACQGAWGGSNACIVNSSGTPGTSTTGLVANANGGGPDPNGGTTSGTAGGYNSTMTTSSPSGAPAKTVVSTSTSYTTSTTVSGNTTYTYRTPVTTTTWSDGSTSTSTGTQALYSTAVTTSETKTLLIGDNVYSFVVSTTTTTYNDGSGTTVVKSLYTNGDMNVAADNQNYVQIFQGNTNADNWASLQNVQAGTSWYCPTCTVTSGTVISVTSDGMGSLYFYIVDANGNAVVSEPGKWYTFTNIVPTVKPAFDGTITNDSSSTITVNNSAGSSGVTTSQQSRIDAALIRQSAVTNNSVYIDQIGNNNTITVLQQSNNNKLKGVDSPSAKIDGDANTVMVRQGNPFGSTTGKNLLELRVVGHDNNVNLNQGVDQIGNLAGADSNNHYQLLNLTGNSNSVTTVQRDGTTGTGHFMETVIGGNNNVVDLKQTTGGNKTIFTSVSGDSNTATVTQQGAGNHYLDLKMSGPGNSAAILQDGPVGHKATIDLTRGTGGANNLDFSQTGSNPLNINFTQTCNIANCGTVIIRQGQ